MRTKKAVHKLTIVPTTGPEAFASIRDELEALTDDELLTISVDIPFAHAIAFGAADRIDPFMAELGKLPDLDMELIRKVRVYASAARHAHLLALTPEQADPQMPALLEDASKTREDMLLQAELLVRFGYVSEARVTAIRAGAGHVDLGNDLEELGMLFNEILPKVKGLVLVTPAMVKHALELGQRLHVALGVKRVGAVASINEPQRTRQRAYTLFVRSYDECRRGIAYLRARQGDAELITPSIYVKQRKRGSNAQVEDTQPEPEVPIPSPATTPVVITELEPTG
jgi:hypothetical protein